VKIFRALHRPTSAIASPKMLLRSRTLPICDDDRSRPSNLICEIRSRDERLFVGKLSRDADTDHRGPTALPGPPNWSLIIKKRQLSVSYYTGTLLGSGNNSAEILLAIHHEKGAIENWVWTATVDMGRPRWVRKANFSHGLIGLHILPANI